MQNLLFILKNGEEISSVEAFDLIFIVETIKISISRVDVNSN